jgi:MerR family transcriptional regulator, light-induced transcriptional regulator
MAAAGNTDEPRHPMRVVVQRTGLSTHVLRAWERRHGAVSPGRTEGGQRLYSDADVGRLQLLRRVTEAGRPIGLVAQLATPELARLAGEDALGGRSSSELVVGVEGVSDGSGTGPWAAAGRTALHLEACLAAAEALDGRGLRFELMRAVVHLDVASAVDGVVASLLERVGDLWAEGRLRPAQEHVVSAAVRQVLDWLLARYEPASGAPAVLVTTPAGELHEFGAMLAGVVAADAGWRVVYLGPSLPPEEVAMAAGQAGAQVVALSTLTGSGVEDVEALAGLLPVGVMLVVGGRGTDGMSVPEGVIVADLNGLRALLAGAAPA